MFLLLSFVPTVGASTSDVDEVETTTEDTGDGEVSPSVTILLVILIGLTILFERMKEYLLDLSTKDTKPIIQSMFGELTVLGFLSLFTFCLSTTGILSEVSTLIFNEHEELQEMLEFVHYMLFFIMIFFVSIVLMLVQGTKNIATKFRLYESATRDKSYIQKVKSYAISTNLIEEFYYDNQSFHSTTSWTRYIRSRFCRSHHHKNPTKLFVKNLLLYTGTRKEFILERSTEYPYRPRPTNSVPEDFNFGRYLTICYSHTLARVVEVNITTWSFFGCYSVLYFFVLSYVTDKVYNLAWIFTGIGWLHLIFRNYFEHHIQGILKTMSVPPIRSSRNDSSQSLFNSWSPDFWSPPFHRKEKNYDCDIIDETERLTPSSSSADFMIGGESTTSDHLYYDSTMALERTSSLRQSTTSFNQEDLYWYGKKGPRLYMTLFQIGMVFTSAYISLLCLAFLPYMLKQTSAVELLIYLLVSITPIYYMIGSLQENVALVTITNSIGQFRHPQFVSQVIREEKTDRLIMALVVMQKLHAAAIDGFDVDQEQHMHCQEHQEDEHTHSVELDLAIKTFKTLDTDGSGDIDATEIKSLLHALNIPTTDETLHTIIQLLDTDNDGSITKDEFINFFKHYIFPKIDDENDNIEGSAKDMFELFDIDKSGDITLGEFKEVIDNFNVGFTVDEIGCLVNGTYDKNVVCWIDLIM